MEIPWIEILRIVLAFAAGTMLGIEREYRDKPAGLRTIILITVGACLFSMLNLSIDSDSRDRIASNVVTGVGFVGAGVIFKEGMSVHGLTSAAIIWVAAAIGMALGFGNYWLALATLLLTLTVLTLVTKLEGKVESKVYMRDFKFSFDKQEYSLKDLEKEFNKLNINYKRYRLTLHSNELVAEYKLKLSKSDYDGFLDFILNNKQLKHFQEMI